jgi:hypothetical protein
LLALVALGVASTACRPAPPSPFEYVYCQETDGDWLCELGGPILEGSEAEVTLDGAEPASFSLGGWDDRFLAPSWLKASASWREVAGLGHTFILTVDGRSAEFSWGDELDAGGLLTELTCEFDGSGAGGDGPSACEAWRNNLGEEGGVCAGNGACGEGLTCQTQLSPPTCERSAEDAGPG